MDKQLHDTRVTTYSSRGSERMDSTVKGWVFVVPSTFSIGFFPAHQGVTAEIMPWESLMCEDVNLAEFLAALDAEEIPISPACRCFYLESTQNKLEQQFELLFKSPAASSVGSRCCTGNHEQNN